MADNQNYAPKPGPVQDDPQLTEIVQWAQREFESLGRQLTNFDVLQQNVLGAAPEKPRTGMFAYADGTHWNPGAGAGQYVYNGTTWVLSSSGPISSVDLTPYMQKSQNLNDVANKATARTNLGISTVGNTGQWADILGKPAFGNVIGYNVNVAGGVPLLQASGHYEAFDGSHIANIPNATTWPYPAIGASLTAVIVGYNTSIGWGGAIAGVYLGMWQLVPQNTSCGVVWTPSVRQWTNLGGTWYNLNGDTQTYLDYGGAWVRLG